MLLHNSLILVARYYCRYVLYVLKHMMKRTNEKHSSVKINIITQNAIDAEFNQFKNYDGKISTL